MFKEMSRFFSTANIRSTLAILVIILNFYVVHLVMKDGHVTVDEMGLVGSVSTLTGVVLSFYFGSSKTEADRSKKESE